MNEDKASEKDVAEVAARAGRAFERLVHTMATLRTYTRKFIEYNS